MDELQFNNLSISNNPFIVTENGVFANRDIERGDYICCYPIDALLYKHNWNFVNNKFKINGKHNIEIHIHLKNNFGYKSSKPLYNNNNNNSTKYYDYFTEQQKSDMFNQFDLAELHPDSYCNNSCVIFCNVTGTSNESVIIGDRIGHLIKDGAKILNPLQEHEIDMYIEESTRNQNVDFNHILKKYNVNGVTSYGLDIFASRDILHGEELFLFFNVDHHKKYNK